MGVSVDSKHGHRLPGAGERPSLLGGGLLERARSTTLALLGVTAAVGLAMVALALNQSWPLIAGSAIPAAPHLGVGKAAVVAATSPRLIPATGAVAPPSSAHSRDAASRSGGGSANDGSAGGSADFVVSPSSPVSGEDSGAGRQVPVGNPRPAPPQSEQAAATPAAKQPAPAPAQTTPAATTPVASGAGTPPPQTAEVPQEEAPEEGSSEEEEQDEEESEDWQGGRHGRGHGHHWGWGD
jgi:hypothetical protein